MRQVALVALVAAAIALGLAGTLKANPPSPKFRPTKESTVTTTYTTQAVPAQAPRAVHVQAAPRAHAAHQVFVPTAQFVPVYAQPVARQAVFVPVQAPRLREVVVDPCLPTPSVPATDGLPSGPFVPASGVGFTPGTTYQHTETQRQSGRFFFRR